MDELNHGKGGDTMAKKLSEKQVAAIEYLALPKRGGLTYQQIADELDVSRRTLDRWRNDDTFMNALNRRIMRSLSDRLQEVIQSVPDHIINDGNAAMFRTSLHALGLLTERLEVENRDDGTADKDEIGRAHV